MQSQKQIISTIFQDTKGILAADESVETMNKRLAEVGIEESYSNRLFWRNVLIHTPEIETYVSGVILSQEAFAGTTLTNKTLMEVLSEKGIVSGLKVDKGLEDAESFTHIKGEFFTTGLDTLDALLEEAKSKNISFTKWRCIFSVGNGRPSTACVERNVADLCLYAKKVLDVGLVPIVEPEILATGTHNIDTMYLNHKSILKEVVRQFSLSNIDMTHVIFKIAFVTDGFDCPTSNTDEGYQGTYAHKVATYTKKLIQVFPSSIGGIVFLSGGIPDYKVNRYLNELKKLYPPVNVSFSFGRSLQKKGLRVWEGKDVHVREAQAELRHSFLKASNALAETTAL